MSECLLEKLKQYGVSDFYPLHMPGHKRRISPLGDPFAIDITEIDGFDDLHHAQGILLEAQRRAARLYGAEETYYLVNGSTCGILAAVSASVARGGRLLLARNSHRSCYHAAFLNELRVTYIYPPILRMDEMTAGVDNVPEKKVPLPGAQDASGGRARRTAAAGGICGSIRPEDVREALCRHPDIQAVLVTSPTYDGVVSDIGAIAEATHAAGAVLIVDEAHGAHFGMHPYFPERALAHGADIVINSLHKTLPSLTQTALLHVQGERVDREKLRRYLDIYQTSSPSYVLMAGMDTCVRLLEEQGRELFDAFVKRLERLRDELRQRLRVLRLVDKDTLIYDFDRSKVLISTAAVSGEMNSTAAVSGGMNSTAVSPGRMISTAAVPGEMISAARSGQLGRAGSCAADRGADSIMMSGPELAAILREKYHLEPEMAAADYVTAIMTVADTQEGFDRLTAALLEIDAKLAEGMKEALQFSDSRSDINTARETDRYEAGTEGSGGEGTDVEEQAAAAGSTDVTEQAAAAGSADVTKQAAAAGSTGVTEQAAAAGSTDVTKQAAAAGSTDMAGSAAGMRWVQYSVNEEVLTIRRAQESPSELLPLSDSAGRVSAEYVYLYPPGIPLLVPGERISEGLLRRLSREQDAGLALRGLADGSGGMIRVVDEAAGV